MTIFPLKHHHLEPVIRISMIIASVLLLNVSCSTPASKMHNYAISHNLKAITFHNTDIPLRSYTNTKKQEQIDTAYIYLEGDGQPWEKGLWPAEDPNSRNPIMLSLMSRSNKPSLYLARPCYGWEKMPKSCHTRLWTSGRYSEMVVHQLNLALTQYKKDYYIKRYIIIGHSGGGALAMLLAARREDIAAVLTLAGNLDHPSWTQHFGYLPLSDSLPPPAISSLPLLQSKQQTHWHLIAKKDKVIPLPLIERAIKRYPGARSFYFQDFDHRHSPFHHIKLADRTLAIIAYAKNITIQMLWPNP